MTLQGYDLRAFGGVIDQNRSTYADDELVSSSQRRLYELIGTDQVLWCSKTEPDLCGETGRYLHDIDIDAQEILVIIDSLVWCHILKYGDRYIPDSDHRKLWFQVLESDAENIDEEFQKIEDEYIAKNLPTDLWSNVLKSTVDRDSDQILLPFPPTLSSIVNVTIVTDEMAKKGRR